MSHPLTIYPFQIVLVIQNVKDWTLSVVFGLGPAFHPSSDGEFSAENLFGFRSSNSADQSVFDLDVRSL